MLDFSLLTRDPRRWLCTSCDAEGRGPEPKACPYCQSHAIFASSEYGKDPQPMRAILHDLMEMVADIQRWSYLQ